MRSVYVLLSIAGILPSAFWGQANVRQQLHQAFAFQEQGHFDKVIALVPALIQSGSLAPVSYTHLDVYKRQDPIRLHEKM